MTLKWQNLADTVLMKASKLTPVVRGPTDTVCSLTEHSEKSTAPMEKT